MTSTSTLGPLQPGQRPPEFALPSTSSHTIELENYRGKVRVALVFVGDHEHPESVVADLSNSLVEFGSRRVQLLVVVSGPMATAWSVLPPEGTVPVLSDGNGSVTNAYGAEGTAQDVRSFLIDEQGLLTAMVVTEQGNVARGLLDALDDSESPTG